MKIILAVVASLDGKTTKWRRSKIYEWTSQEDRLFFSALLHNSDAMIMGRKTFDATRMLIPRPSKTLRIVLTHEPDAYAAIAAPGQLEFTNETPRELIHRLDARGFCNTLIAGGEDTNTAFLKEKFVDEVYVTIEPVIFGSGNNLVLENELDIQLTLKQVKKLNRRGTLLLKYDVQK